MLHVDFFQVGGQRSCCTAFLSANSHCLYSGEAQRPPPATPGLSRISFRTGAARQYRARPSVRNGRAMIHFRCGFSSGPCDSEGSILSPPSAIVRPNPGTEVLCDPECNIAPCSASIRCISRAFRTHRATNSQTTAPNTTTNASIVTMPNARFIMLSQNVQLSPSIAGLPPCSRRLIRKETIP